MERLITELAGQLSYQTSPAQRLTTRGALWGTPFLSDAPLEFGPPPPSLTRHRLGNPDAASPPFLTRRRPGNPDAASPPLPYPTSPGEPWRGGNAARYFCEKCLGHSMLSILPSETCSGQKMWHRMDPSFLTELGDKNWKHLGIKRGKCCPFFQKMDPFDVFGFAFRKYLDKNWQHRMDPSFLNWKHRMDPILLPQKLGLLDALRLLGI